MTAGTQLLRVNLVSCSNHLRTYEVSLFILTLSEGQFLHLQNC